MEIKKAAGIAGAPEITEAQLEKINRLTRRPLTKEQVYVFSVRLCDDQPDRDGERFDAAALPRLAELFVGKTGIVDHAWSAEKQVARIFAAETAQDGAARYIRAWAYMLRGEKTDPIIAEIDGGIKKEVSVGCSMGRRVCSVCGQDYDECPHQKGERYGDQVCTAILTDPKDAYEFPFVAVPAQPAAGVVKGLGERPALGEFVEKHGTAGQRDELKALRRAAEDGRAWREELQGEVVKLSLLLDVGLDEATLRTVAARLETGELRRMRDGLEKKAAGLFPPDAQLPQAGQTREKCGEEYLI